MDEVVISSFVRTPIGGFCGALSALSATQLGAVAVREAVRRAEAPAEAIDEIIMGCVLAAGLGQAPARQAALGAGLLPGVEATTINKMCGSGLRAVMLAADAIKAGSAHVVVAGGMESMSNAPYLLPKHRSGARIGHDRAVDSMYLDGLEDAYESGRLMGVFAEATARERRLTRAAQDSYALESLERARSAQARGAFTREMAPVEAPAKGGAVTVHEDEQPRRADPSRIPTLKPAFAEGGTITAANASSISDGAAALLVTHAAHAERHGWPVAARIVAYASHAQAPSQFTTAPAPAIRKALDRAGWTVADVDLFEINEAFAAVAMIAMDDLGLSRKRLNVNGGACALGHPIGASGARVLVTLIAAMEARGVRRGVASLCVGGGEAVAIAVLRP